MITESLDKTQSSEETKYLEETQSPEERQYLVHMEENNVTNNLCNK